MRFQYIPVKVGTEGWYGVLLRLVRGVVKVGTGVLLRLVRGVVKVGTGCCCMTQSALYDAMFSVCKRASWAPKQHAWG